MVDLARALRDSRARLLEVALDLDDEQWLGPRLSIVNPMRWELGHIAWFQEHWVLRHARGLPPLRADGDALYDSAKVAHDTRWDLPLPDRRGTLAYMGEILARTLAALDDGQHRYFHELALFHEDMHAEAFLYTRQTLGHPTPSLAAAVGVDRAGFEAGPLPGDASIAGARFLLGARRDDPAAPFVFDNEKWAHEVDVAPFRIARACVTNADFARFVDDGGYRRRALWSDEGWAWRASVAADHPVYWRRVDGGAGSAGTGWLLRTYDVEVPLPSHRPVLHLAWFEADAYCRWAGRRLPTEAEWELAAGGVEKRLFPWGNEAPTPAHANLDGRALGPIDVGACPAGDTPDGCRQMFGNAWEWTATDFAPYPGFVVDPYAEYSAPWFDSPHKVLRGGCWATRARLLRNTWRNFYPPDRRDVFAGFRTCAL